MNTPFNTASRFLQRLAVPSFPEVHDLLVALVRAGNIVDAFKTCFPEKMPQLGGLGLFEMEKESLLALQQAAIPAVAALFPV